MRFSIVTSRPVHVVCLSLSLKEVFLARHAIFLGNQMYKKILSIMARCGTYLQTARIFCLYFEHGEFLFKLNFKMK